MAATCSVEVHERAHAIFPRIRNLATSKGPRRLSPIWESYILGILQPSYRITLQDCETSSARWPTTRIAMLRKVIDFHPFNLSDEEVNLARGRTLLTLLGNRTAEPDTQSTPWWPQDAASLVEAVRREREEMESLGYMKGAKQREVAQTTAAGACEEENDVNTSIPPTLKRKHSMSEGSAT